jgi:hypothetical protein
MHELFVYYRVRAGREQDAWKIVDAFQASLRQQLPGLVARLLCRSGEGNALQTWMETYAMPSASADGGLGAERQRLIEAAARPLAPCIDGSRHTEVFVPVARG